MIFVISLLLVVWASLRWCSRLGHSETDAFWIFVGTVMLQIGAITSLTSVFHRLTPANWVLLQGLICVVSASLTGGFRRPTHSDFRQRWSQLRSRVAGFAAALSFWGRVALTAIGGVLLLSMVMQSASRLQNFDDRVYHASRVIYWIQHQTVLPFETHNIRQTIVPFGSELFFLWPVLLTKTEWVGRLVFWSAFPLAAAGQYVLLRALKLSQTVSLAGALILISTPLVATSANGLKPELWSCVALLGVAYWAISLCSATEGEKTKCFFLGAFAILSVNIRAFPVSMLPSLMLILLWTPGLITFRSRLKVFSGGLLCAALLSTLLIPLSFNTALYHDPLGPSEVRSVVRADITPRVIYTHAVRFAFLLAELPNVPVSADIRNRISGAANHFISSVGAGSPLAGENDLPWPGKFTYTLPDRSTRYSLWGLLWIPTLLMGALFLIRNITATWPRVKLNEISVQALLALPLLGAVLFGARWMVQAEVPGRFLVSPYSLALPLGMALIAPHLSARKVAQVIIAMVVAYSIYPPVRSLAVDVLWAIGMPPPEKAINEPFDEIVDSILPPGSRVLFVGNQDARDYPLFSPRTHYANTVIPWGTGAFDPEKMGRLIAAEKVTHVLIQNDSRVLFQWFPPLDTREMVDWLAAAPGMTDVPLRTLGMRLFEVHGAASMNEMSLSTSDRNSSHSEAGDLAYNAVKAVDLISSRQQADGYWLTSYTSEARYDGPRLEMNTYVTSLMVDVLGSRPDPPGLAGNLVRARHHLRSQIEEGGLVRYHGRPDSRAMTTLGLCPITPDADDTALVWRLAPGADALRSTALGTLAQYRTAEGLYKTWLGQRSEYQCIDPGTDPNPTDVGIQMNVLLWMAQADPEAAHSLCKALRQTIDQSRLWVYYDKAPLVPMMRLASLKAAGCELQLPPSRSQTSVEEQRVWLAAGQLLHELESSKDQARTGVRALSLLEELSNNGFASVRRNPPLLYHNDLSASVRRFYWSEDVGYALWLRLYWKSVRLGLLTAGEEDDAGQENHTRQDAR